MFFAPIFFFSLSIYLLFRYNEPLNFLLCKSAPCSLKKISCQHCTRSISGFMGIYFWLKFFVISFSWDIYLLFRHYELFKFLVCKSAPCSLSKKLLVSCAPDQSLVLLFCTFCQKFPNFDQDNVTYFWALLKPKGQLGGKIVNSRNLMFLEGVNRDIVSGPQKNFWVQEEALKSDFLKVFRSRQFLTFSGASKTKRTAGEKNCE